MIELVEVGAMVDHETPWIGMRSLIVQVTRGHMLSLKRRTLEDLREMKRKTEAAIAGEQAKPKEKQDGSLSFCLGWALSCVSLEIEWREGKAEMPAEGFSA